MFKSLINRYRLHAHSLNIETGRYYHIDRHARMCNMCSNSDMEDEHHFILECSKYVEIRRKYIKPYYCINPSVFKLSVSITFCISSVCTIIETTLYCSNTLFQKQYSLYVYKNKLQTIHDTLYTIHNYIIIIIAI
jgi:hypothetical protein